MSVTDKMKHAAQDAKGKAKEAAGKVTGNDRMRAEGEVGQKKAHAAHAADKAKETAKNLGQQAKGKAEQAKGKAEEMAGRAKQRMNK